MSAQVATDIESVKSNIKQALMGKGGIVTSPEGTMRSVQKLLRIRCSGERFDDAIGSLIHHGELLRHRPEPMTRDGEDRPITICFPQFVQERPYRGSCVQ